MPLCSTGMNRARYISLFFGGGGGTSDKAIHFTKPGLLGNPKKWGIVFILDQGIPIQPQRELLAISLVQLSIPERGVRVEVRINWKYHRECCPEALGSGWLIKPSGAEKALPLSLV